MKILESHAYQEARAAVASLQVQGYVTRGPFVSGDSEGVYVWRVEAVTVYKWIEAFPDAYRAPAVEGEQ